MKNRLLMILAISIMIIGCSSGNSNNSESSSSSENSNNEFLTIEGTDIWIRKYPSDGEVILKLNTGDKCEILEIDKEETIKGVTDNWYKINYNGTEGYVFGSQTSLKKEQTFVTQDYTLPKEVIYYTKDICNVDALTKFYPIGFSKDNNFAYLKVKYEWVAELTTYEIILQDLVTDKTTSLVSSKKEGENCKEFENNVKNFWNNNLTDLKSKLNSNQIIQDFNISFTEKCTSDNLTYTFKTTPERKKVESDGDVYNSKFYVVNSNNQKKIFKNIEKDPYFNTHKTLMCLSPYENRVAILLTEDNYSGAYDCLCHDYEIIGCSLTEKFE